MHNPFFFFRDVWKQPRWVFLWLLVLIGANLASLFFWEETIARVVFAVFVISSVLMMTLYARFGYEKILGAGHSLWPILLIYLAASYPQTHGGFSVYLVMLMAVITTSLCFDVVDVYTYWRHGPGSHEDQARDVCSTDGAPEKSH